MRRCYRWRWTARWCSFGACSNGAWRKNARPDPASSTEGNTMRICAFVCALAAAVVMPATVQAQTSYPTKPIRFVVPYPAGGATDYVARLIGERLSKSVGQTVVIDNK